MSHPDHPAATPAPGRRPSLATIATVAGIVIPVLGLLVALGQWLLPREGGGDNPGTGNAAATGTPAVLPGSAATSNAAASAPATATATDAAPTGTALSTLPREAGELTTLPRALAGKPGLEGALVIACPSNQSNDKVRTVTLLLSGRYLDLTATLRAYFPKDPKLRASLTAVGVWRERDGTSTYRTLGAVVAKGETTPTVTGALEGAEKLRLQVTCDLPTGHAIVTGHVIEAS
ncbi:hypothetical protein [Luedemannella helvata]|uniref:Secreted protein n=1 Tax=Luedemannella helvata TaxID=349315 RepID=A0ABP4WLK1_9ACTN